MKINDAVDNENIFFPPYMIGLDGLQNSMQF